MRPPSQALARAPAGCPRAPPAGRGARAPAADAPLLTVTISALGLVAGALAAATAHASISTAGRAVGAVSGAALEGVGLLARAVVGGAAGSAANFACAAGGAVTRSAAAAAADTAAGAVAAGVGLAVGLAVTGGGAAAVFAARAVADLAALSGAQGAGLGDAEPWARGGEPSWDDLPEASADGVGEEEEEVVAPSPSAPGEDADPGSAFEVVERHGVARAAYVIVPDAKAHVGRWHSPRA